MFLITSTNFAEMKVIFFSFFRSEVGGGGGGRLVHSSISEIFQPNTI